MQQHPPITDNGRVLPAAKTSAAVVKDLYQSVIKPDASPKTIKNLTKISTIVITLVIFVLSLTPPDNLQNVVIATYLFNGMGIVNWKMGMEPIVIGVIVSLVLTVVVSLLIPKSPYRIIDTWFSRKPQYMKDKA